MLEITSDINWETLSKHLIESEDNIVQVRQLVRHHAKQMTMGIIDQTRVTTAVSELLRNMYNYGGGGEVLIEKGIVDDKIALIKCGLIPRPFGSETNMFAEQTPFNTPMALPRGSLLITCTDYGSGIEDLELAMSDGYTSGKGMGYGLPGAKRLVDSFEIQSELNIGTIVRVMKWK